MIRTTIRLTIGLLLLAASAVQAHDALPVVLSLDQTGPRDYRLTMRVPPAIPDAFAPSADVAEPCTVVDRKGSALTVRCPDSAPPSAIMLTYPHDAATAPILLRLSYKDDTERTLAQTPGATRIDLPARVTGATVFSGYFGHGLDHLIGGADHLLFLICLMLIARTPRRLLWTVTGFTLGHAVTISLAALGMLIVDSGTVEILIALSIAFVAAEIVRGRRDTLTWEKPALVAALFGLLHGLGFAGALRSIGLPSGEVPMALLAFNLGIELGQLAFVLILALPFWTAMRWWQDRRGTIQALVSRLIAWPVGILASLWVFERLQAI